MSYASKIDAFANVRLAGIGLGSAVAAGTGDTTQVVGNVVNRQIEQGFVDSALVVLDWKTSLTADKTLGFKVTIEYSTNNSTWSTPEFLFGATGSYETVETGADTNKYGQWTYRLQLSPEEQYFRISVTPDLSHTGTDTAVFGFGALLGGSTVNPISQYDTVVTY
jgi:hypothetical protein